MSGKSPGLGSENGTPFFQRPVFHVVLIAVLGLVVYSNTFHVPFVLDGKGLVRDNQIVHSLRYFLDPNSAAEHEGFDAFKKRYVSYFTFALNYRLGGTDVRGYHAVNIAIHISNALLVYCFALLIFRSPFLAGPGVATHAGRIALFSALLFVSHPLQTEAVTYIFQRHASLVALFYLLSVVLYMKARLVTSGRRRAFYALSLLSALLAMKTKENAFTLPFALVLLDLMFFEGPVGPRLLRLVPFALASAIVPLDLMGVDRPSDEVSAGMGQALSGYAAYGRTEYLLTQFRVVVTYLRLLLLPVNQNLDYGYPVLGSLLDPAVFLSFLLLLALLASGVFLFKASRRGEPGLRLIAFGVFWFFITLSVESSIIPIPMLINEYRAYLPSAGLMAAAVSGAFVLGERYSSIRKAALPALVAAVLALSAATYARNAVWGSELSLWEDTARKGPDKERPRAHYNLGIIYHKMGRLEDAERELKAVLRKDPGSTEAHINLGVVYMDMGRLAEAVEEFEETARLDPHLAEAQFDLGVAHGKQGFHDMAAKAYRAAIEIDPGHAEAHNNLGAVYIEMGLYGEAVEEFQTAAGLKPESAVYRANLARAVEIMREKEGRQDKGR